MLSFTGQRTQCQDMSQDYETDSLTFFKTNLNLGQRLLEAELGSFYTEDTASVTTVASTSTYDLPAEFIRLKKAYTTDSTTQYPMQEVFDEEEWRWLNSTTSPTDPHPTHIFVRRESFEVYPKNSTASLTMTLIYERGAKDLTATDYTTGTILTLANGGTAVTGSGTTWTSAMAGRYLKVTNNGVWYKIATFLTTTTLTLDRAYEGLAIATGSEAYIIGEMSRTPGPTHHIPVYYALFQYYLGFKQNENKAKVFRDLYEIDLARAKRTYGRRYSSKYIPGNSSRIPLVNPNHYPLGMT